MYLQNLKELKRVKCAINRKTLVFIFLLILCSTYLDNGLSVESSSFDSSKNKYTSSSIIDTIKDGDHIEYSIKPHILVNETGHTHYSYDEDKQRRVDKSGELTINFFYDEIGLSAFINWEYSTDIVYTTTYLENKENPEVLDPKKITISNSIVTQLYIVENSDLKYIIWNTTDGSGYLLPFINLNVAQFEYGSIIPFSGRINDSLAVKLVENIGNGKFGKEYSLKSVNSLNTSKKNHFLNGTYDNLEYWVHANKGVLTSIVTGTDPLFEIFLGNLEYFPTNFKLQLVETSLTLNDSNANSFNFVFYAFIAMPILTMIISFVYLKKTK